MAETIEKILQLKKHLERYFERDDATEKILYVFKKLERLPITLDMLQETRIGKVVNSYRKHGGGIGDRARTLVAYWKQLLSEQTDEPEPAQAVVIKSETSHETSYDSRMRIPNMEESPPKERTENTPLEQPRKKPKIHTMSESEEEEDRVSERRIKQEPQSPERVKHRDNAHHHEKSRSAHHHEKIHSAHRDKTHKAHAGDVFSAQGHNEGSGEDSGTQHVRVKEEPIDDEYSSGQRKSSKHHSIYNQPSGDKHGKSSGEKLSKYDSDSKHSKSDDKRSRNKDHKNKNQDKVHKSDRNDEKRHSSKKHESKHKHQEHKSSKRDKLSEEDHSTDANNIDLSIVKNEIEEERRKEKEKKRRSEESGEKGDSVDLSIVKKEKSEKRNERERKEEKRNERERVEEKRNERERTEEKRNEGERTEEKRNEKERTEEKRNESERTEEKRNERERTEEKRNEKERTEEKRSEKREHKHKSHKHSRRDREEKERNGDFLENVKIKQEKVETSKSEKDKESKKSESKERHSAHRSKEKTERVKVKVEKEIVPNDEHEVTKSNVSNDKHKSAPSSDKLKNAQSSDKSAQSRDKPAQSNPDFDNQGVSFEDMLMASQPKVKKKKGSGSSKSSTSKEKSVKLESASESSHHKSDKSSSKSKHSDKHHKDRQDKTTTSSSTSSSGEGKKEKSSNKRKRKDKEDGDERKEKKPKLEIPPPPKEVLQLQSTDLMASLPEISPNYKPLPKVDMTSPSRHLAIEEIAMSIGTKSYARTQVYSGRKNLSLPSVPTLYNACLQVLQDNIDSLDFVGGVPYDILRPVLSKATAAQLYNIEDVNPQFIGETEELWEVQCKKDFRNKQKDEFESWRELYIRCHDERDRKLKALTAKVSNNMAKALPVRQAMLAYVDGPAKAPRGVRRAQIRNGTAGSMKKQDPLSKLSSHGGKTVKAPAPLPPPPPPMHKKVKSVAPMMKKTLRFIKNVPSLRRK